MNKKEPLLKVEHLYKDFHINKKLTVNAVCDVSLQIYPGEIYCLVGESGSGKSTIGRSIIHLYKPTSGKIIFDGHDISGNIDKSVSNHMCKNMQMIFQDPMSSLNSKKTIGNIISQGLDLHNLFQDQTDRQEKIISTLNKVGINSKYLSFYPSQLSGGQRQRVCIARSLIMCPKLIIADECISALDVSIQAQIINLMKEIQADTKCAYIFITHNLAVAHYIADKIGILYQGHLIEAGTKYEIFENPIHPYTKSFISSTLQPNPKLERNREVQIYKENTGEQSKAREVRHITKTHYVFGSEKEFNSWIK